MAQWKADTQTFDQAISRRYEVTMLANNSNGDIVSTSNPLPVMTNNEFIYAAPWDLQVARGKVSGVSQINIFGFSSGVAQTFIPLWEANTTISFPTNAIQMNVRSTSVDDNATSQITISGLNSDWNEIIEVINLNGTANVTTANSFLRINSMAMTTPPSDHTTNQGTISARNGTGTAHALILPGVGRMQNAWYSVPAGKSFYVRNINSFCGESKSGASPDWIYYRVLTTNNITRMTSTLLTTNFQHEYKVLRTNPVRYTQKLDVQWQYAASDGTKAISLILEGLLISDTAA
jgi:hypothetical protein